MDYQSTRTAKYVVGLTSSGQPMICHRSAYVPNRGFTFVSSHRTREAAIEAANKLKPVKE